VTTRVLIVDDSATMRAILTRLLDGEPDIEVIGAAADAMQARGMIRELNPDVVTLDIEMPGMNGLDFLGKIMQLRPMPVVIVSGITRKNCDTTIRALELGAVDCYAKPDGSVSNLIESDGGSLAQMVREASRVRFVRVPAAGNAPKSPVAPPPVARQTIAASQVNGAGVRLIAIGASTGGVEALHRILPAFPANCPPTVIVQHISAAFAPAMAERLDRQCTAKVQLLESGGILRPGNIYIAPGNDKHAMVGGGETIVAKMIPGELTSGHRPSIDALFDSVAQKFGPTAVGILLTGMGQDGARGLLAMRRSGARTIAQDEATSTVYGMPRAAADLGAAEKILPLPHIAERALAAAGM